MPGVFPRPPVRGVPEWAAEPPRFFGVLGDVFRVPEGPEADISCENLHLLPNRHDPFAKAKQGLWLHDE